MVMQMLTYSYEVGVLGISDSNNRMNFLNQFLLFIILKMHIPLSQTSFSCSVLDQDKPNLESKNTS